MANTTFSGPVRSQNGFQTVSIDSTTGAVTTTAAFGSTVATPGTVSALTGTAPVAGGAEAVLLTSTAGLGIYVGSGAPTISAAQGSLYIRTDGSSTSTRLYVNTTGSTTWTNVTTAA
jgi:hypothetical protein